VTGFQNRVSTLLFMMTSRPGLPTGSPRDGVPLHKGCEPCPQLAIGETIQAKERSQFGQTPAEVGIEMPERRAAGERASLYTALQSAFDLLWGVSTAQLQNEACPHTVFPVDTRFVRILRMRCANIIICLDRSGWPNRFSHDFF